jgi:RNA polymerase primary sigma factor
LKQLVITASTTHRDSESIQRYFREISQYDLLTAEQEVDLAIRIQNGDLEALDQMVKANLRFVVSVAKKYQHLGLSLSDLINEGNLGLLKAAQLFDHTKGFKFISYAVWWIRQNILKAIQDHGRTVRIPSNKLDAIYKVKKKTANLEQAFERMPTSEELAEALDLKHDLVTGCLELDQNQVSFDAPLSDEPNAGTRLDVMADEAATPLDSELVAADLGREVAHALQTLPVKEADCLRMYFGLCGIKARSLDEIAARFDVTRERARQIRDKALVRLRSTGTLAGLNVYLG